MVAVYYCDLDDYDKLNKDDKNYKVKIIQIIEMGGKIKSVFKVLYINDPLQNGNIVKYENASIGTEFYELNKNIISLKCPGNETENKTILKNKEDLNIINAIVLSRNKRI